MKELKDNQNSIGDFVLFLAEYWNEKKQKDIKNALSTGVWFLIESDFIVIIYINGNTSVMK